MTQIAQAQPRLLTEANLIRRGNRYTAIRAPLIKSAADVVKLPKAYRTLYEQHFIPHLERAGCVALATVQWDWTAGSRKEALPEAEPVSVEDHPYGVNLARQIMSSAHLLEVGGECGIVSSVPHPAEAGGEYSYELLPVPRHDASWFRRIRLITQDLRWKPHRPWPPVGVMVTELVAYPAGEQVNWVGVVLAGSLEQRAGLRQSWMRNLGIVGNPETPYLGLGW